MLGLRSRVALAFGLVSFTVAVIVAASAYVVARNYLVTQRESASLTRALLDARAVAADLSAGREPGEALAPCPRSASRRRWRGWPVSGTAAA